MRELIVSGVRQVEAAQHRASEEEDWEQAERLEETLASSRAELRAATGRLETIDAALEALETDRMLLCKREIRAKQVRV